MKILHIIHSVDPRSGGPSNAIRNLVREQVSAGHSISVLTTTIQSGEPWSLREDFIRRMSGDLDFAGAELHFARAFGRRKPFRSYGYSPASRTWLKQHLADRKLAPEVIHVHGTFSHLTSAAAACANRYGIPYIVRPAGSLDSRCLRRGSRLLKPLFVKLLLQKELDKAACLQATSDAEYQVLCNWVPAERVRIIPHGVGVPNLGASFGLDPELSSRFPQLVGKRIILYMSRLNSIKRPELVLEAIKIIKARRSDVVLLMAGNDAGHLDTVRHLIELHKLKNDVVLAGFLQGKLKQAAFESSDVFVLPSIHENFGVAVVEAMAHGVAVVVTEGVASHVYVDKSNAGLTVQGNSQALAAGIETLLANDPSDYGKRGRAFVTDHLAWSSVVKQLDDLYREILDSGAKNIRMRSKVVK